MKTNSTNLLSRAFKQHAAHVVRQPAQVLLVEANHDVDANAAAEYLANQMIKLHGVSASAQLVIDCADIGIDDIREVQSIAQVGASPSISRIFVLYNYDLLNPTAQNAMLKLLEQPIEGTHYILATAGGAVLATIYSRANRVRVQSMSADDYQHYFPEQTTESITQALRISRGNSKIAQQYLRGELDELQQAKDVLALTKLERLSLSEVLSKDRDKAIRMVVHMQVILLFLCKQRVSEQDNAAAQKLQQSLVTSQLVLRNLRHNGNAKLALDNLFICI